MSTTRGKYVLGREVTAVAIAKKRKETAVISVRVTAQELASIESVSRTSGKSLSQIVREAINTYLYFERGGKYSLTMSVPHETLSTGQVWQSGKAAQSLVEVRVA